MPTSRDPQERWDFWTAKDNGTLYMTADQLRDEVARLQAENRRAPVPNAAGGQWMPYSHRNGETEPPTEPGWYWFDGDGAWSGGPTLKRPILLVVEDDEHTFWFGADDDADDACADGWLKGQWWGPIVPPWEPQPPAPQPPDYSDIKRRYMEAWNGGYRFPAEAGAKEFGVPPEIIQSWWDEGDNPC